MYPTADCSALSADCHGLNVSSSRSMCLFTDLDPGDDVIVLVLIGEAWSERMGIRSRLSRISPREGTRVKLVVCCVPGLGFCICCTLKRSQLVLVCAKRKDNSSLTPAAYDTEQLTHTKGKQKLTKTSVHSRKREKGARSTAGTICRERSRARKCSRKLKWECLVSEANRSCPHSLTILHDG